MTTNRLWNHTNLKKTLKSDLEKILNTDTNERFFNVNLTLIDELAGKFTIFMKKSIIKYGGFDDNIVFTCFDIYEDAITRIYENTTPNILKLIYNSKIYSWCDNNCSHFLVFLAIDPTTYLFDSTDEVTTLLYKPTKKNIHQLFVKLYDLVVKYNLKLDIWTIGWFNKPLYEYLDYNQTFFIEYNLGKNSHNTDYSQNYIKYYKLFKLLCKHGKNINNILGNMVLKNYRKRKSVTLFIENWWFELIHSPYSKIGIKLMEKRTKKFIENLEQVKEIK